MIHAFINELKEEGITYVAPWRPKPQVDGQVPTVENATASALEQEHAEEGAVGYDLTTTSSDFGSMCLEEAASIERSSKRQSHMLRTMCNWCH